MTMVRAPRGREQAMQQGGHYYWGEKYDGRSIVYFECLSRFEEGGFDRMGNVSV